MSEKKYTPGPWFIGALESGQAAVDAASGDVTGWVSIPDAHLIAAAPEMLGALESLLTRFERVCFPVGVADQPEVIAAVAAIKKARGES